MCDEIMPIHMEYKDKIEKIRLKSENTCSSHAFNSIYLWQERMGLQVVFDEDKMYAVKSSSAGENTWLFPCGSEKSIFDFISQKMPEKSFELCYLGKHDVDWLETNFPGKWSFNRLECDDEYICDIKEYIALEGSKFSDMRRYVRKIDAEYDVECKSIDDSSMADAMLVVSEWQDGSHNVGARNLTDEDVAEKALAQKDKLNISGIVMYLNNSPVSVFAGFPLSCDTVDVLIGKCTNVAPRGTIYYALREYLKRLDDRFIYCNHEEDLGIEGIRRIKNSLCPIKKNEMWEAVLK